MTGHSYSAATQFKPGQHWRPRAPHWDAEWLRAAYIDAQRSASDIAAQIGCTEMNIHFWLRKHGIPRRSMSEVRAAKKWGASGPSNPMYGKRGPLCPRYVDGGSPERQRLYSRSEWLLFVAAIYKRDGYRCVRCTAPKAGPRSLHAHHILPWAGHPERRMDAENVVTLCVLCHRYVHSNANAAREFLPPLFNDVTVQVVT